MQVSWRNTLEMMYRDLVREAVQKVWATERVPVDYTRPRQDIDRLTGSVVWLHPRAAISNGNGMGAARAGFYVPRNLRLIHDCDFVLSCIYPTYSSIDSAHEIGVAYAWGKPVITVDLTNGSGDYAAWRAMSLVVLDSLEAAADFLLYQVQEFDVKQQTEELLAAISATATQLNQTLVGDKLPA